MHMLNFLISALLLLTPVAHAQIVPAQNQVTTAPYGGIVLSTSTSPTAKLGQLLGTAAGDILSWNGSRWTNVTTSTLGFLSNITGLITQGTNVTITGAGTSGSPYVINATGGGGGSGTISTSSPLSAGLLVQSTGINTIANIATSSLGLLTTNVAEGSNLYYTDARVGSYITGSTTLPAFLNYWSKSGTVVNYGGGNVGIGTTTPTALLSLGNGVGAAGTTAALGINFGDPAANLYRSSAGILKTDGWLFGSQGLIGSTVQFNTMFPTGDSDLTIQTRAATSRNIIFKSVGTTPTETMRLDTNGNVGIGTTTPDTVLDVVKTGVGRSWTTTAATVATFERSSSAAAGAYLSVISGNTGLARLQLGDTDSEAQGLVQYDNNVNALSLWSSALQRLTIGSTGLVGIATSTPSSPLDVFSTGAVVLTLERNTVGANVVARYQNSSGSFYAGLSDANAFGIGSTAALSSAFLTVTTAGNVGVGTTTPTAHLDVFNTLGSAASLLRVSTTTAANTFSSLFEVNAAGATAFNASYGTSGYVLQSFGSAAPPQWVSTTTLGFSGGGAGTVTSVALTTPTGLSISGSPVTTSGTLALSLTAGYVIPLTASTTDWNTAYLNRITSANLPLSITSNAISIANAAADGATKGAASFTANDFDASSGNISLDYTNGQKATASVPGFLSSTDWSAFNNKQATISATWPITLTGATIGFGGLSTTSQPSSSNLLVSNGTNGVYGVATSTLTASSPLTGSFVQIGSGGALGCQTASGSQAGCLSSTDWTTFNSKGSGTVTNVATDATLTGGAITTTGTLGLNLTNPNTWTGLQQFSNATSTLFSTKGQTWLGTNPAVVNIGSPVAGGSGLVLWGQDGPTVWHSVTLSVSSIGASNKTLTLPNVTDTLAVLGTAQTFTALQQFNANASTTNFSVSTNSWFSGIASAARLVISGISSAFTPSVEGEVGIDTTDNQFKFFAGGATRVLSPTSFLRFSYATSTAWTGTTTRQLGPAPVNATWQWAKCFTDTGTVQVSFNDGTNRMNFINASTTIGTTTLSTNNAVTNSMKQYVDLGTPLSSPTQVSCTVAYTIDPT